MSTDPRSAFRHAAFRRFQFARFALTVAFQIQSLAVGWQVYELTKRPIDLGYTGLAQFLPMALLSLAGGHAADRYDRLRVLTASLWGAAFCGVGLAICAVFGAGTMPIFGFIILFGACRAFAGPASSALLPRLVPQEDFANAVAWNSTTWQVATILGPAIGGALYALMGGAAGVYVASALLTGVGIFTLQGLGVAAPPTETRAASWSSVLEGLRYVRAEPMLLGAMSLDLFAVLLGGAVALLPIFARDVLDTGPLGLGLLRAAPGVGAAITAITFAYRPIARQVGRWLFAMVALYGVATIAFGASTSFTVSLAALVVVGGADMVSVVIRQMLIQLHTPDAMRGRVSAVSQVFIGASNELGEFESGLAAQWLGAVRAVVFGGMGTLVVVFGWALAFPSLRRVDRIERPSRAAEG